MGLRILFGLVYKALMHVLYTCTNGVNLILLFMTSLATSKDCAYTGSTQLLAMLKLDD